MSRTKGIALPGKSMEEATRNAQKDFLSKNPKAVDSATVKSGTEESPIVQNRHSGTGQPRTPMTCNALKPASTDTRASRSTA
jgi:hypothetical protein